MKAIVKVIRVSGIVTCHTLKEACDVLVSEEFQRIKLSFLIRFPDGAFKTITIRDEDEETVAYGDFEGLPSFLDYVKEVEGRCE